MVVFRAVSVERRHSIPIVLGERILLGRVDVVE